MHSDQGVQERKQKLVRVVQFAVYCWAMRLGFVGIGSILVSFIQFFVPSGPLNLKPYHLNIRNWNSVVHTNYQNILESREPVLYKGIGVISPSLLLAKFSRITPIESMILKLSTISDFSHFDESRLWSKSFLDQRSYSFVSSSQYFQSKYHHKFEEFFQKAPIEEFFQKAPIEENKVSEYMCSSSSNSEGGCVCYQGSEHYVYGTHRNALSYVPALSPDFAQFIALENSTPQVCMWISSTNVTASVHFDLEDNFLLQIYGQKKIVIVSPEALSILNPHSSWHPNWRQAANVTGLRTTKDLLSHLDNMLLSRTEQLTQTPQAPSSSVHRQPTVPVTPTVTKKRTTTSTFLGEVKIWEATLLPGDAIYIPAGYFHTVTSGTDTPSLSVNSWFSSELSDLYTQFDNFPLPFAPDDSDSLKVSRLVQVVTYLLLKLDVPASEFSTLMRARYENMLSGVEDRDYEESTICVTDTDKYCAICVLPEQFSDLLLEASVIDTYESLYTLIRAKTRITRALVLVVLLDYAEEVLQLIWGDAATTPARAIAFAKHCLPT